MRRLIPVYRAAVNSYVPAYAIENVDKLDEKREETPMLERLE